MAKEKAIETADFRVYGTIERNGKPFDKKVHYELHKSGAFDYGNGTMMVMKFEGEQEFLYDTRYEKIGVFKEYAKNHLKNYVADGLKVEEL